MHRLAFALIPLLLSFGRSHAADAVGFRQIDLAGPRPLTVTVWYPAADTKPLETFGENKAFYGTVAMRNATPGSSHSRPLVVLSHGYGGSWRNLGWLAVKLVAKGYVVAAPDHPGTTTFDRSLAQAAMLWQRPRDLSRVIDRMVADASPAGAIDPRRIAAIGHSLGGWTVAALAGARFDAARFGADCIANHNPRTCGLASELGIAASLEKETPLGGDMADARVGAFVSLDLGLARGFTPQSLAGVHKPFLVIGAGIDIGDLPAKMESGYLAAHLPRESTRYVAMPNAMHFSFMQECKPGAAALIEEETPGDGIVCRDGEGGRAAIHEAVADMVTDHLARAFPAQEPSR
jgi:predicted dienelactone hydrolase